MYGNDGHRKPLTDLPGNRQTTLVGAAIVLWERYGYIPPVVQPEGFPPGQERIHHMHHGVAGCAAVNNDVRLVPKGWPRGNLWSENWAEVNCPLCHAARAAT